MTDSDTLYVKPQAPVCGQGNLLWIIVLLLLIGFGGFITLGAVMGAVGFSSTLVVSMLILSAYCALLLAGLLCTGIILRIAKCCLGDVAHKSVDPKKSDKSKEGVELC